MNKDQDQKAKELTEEHQGDFWKVHDKETNTIYQWDGDKYVLEFNDKQL